MSPRPAEYGSWSTLHARPILGPLLPAMSAPSGGAPDNHRSRHQALEHLCVGMVGGARDVFLAPHHVLAVRLDM